MQRESIKKLKDRAKFNENISFYDQFGIIILLPIIAPLGNYKLTIQIKNTKTFFIFLIRVLSGSKSFPIRSNVYHVGILSLLSVLNIHLSFKT